MGSRFSQRPARLRGRSFGGQAALVVCLLCAAQGPADAQIVVVGRPTADEDDRDRGGFTQVVAAEEVPGAQSVGDLLGGASGAEVRRTGGVGRAQSLQLRGAGAHQVVVLLDDIPLDAARGGGLDLSAIPLSWVEQVEVLRGPAAALYGSGAQGGVLRLRTATPRWGHRLGGHVQAGPAGLLAGTVGGSVAQDGHHALALATVSRADGDFRYTDTRGDTRRRRNHDHVQGGGLLRGGLALAGGARLTALVEGAPGRGASPGASSSRACTPGASDGGSRAR
jgi:outer membrane cobalamin receptor